jgi:hypothetical protein
VEEAGDRRGLSTAACEGEGMTTIIDFEEYTCEGFDPTEIEFACRSAGLWRNWKATFEKVVIREKLEPRQVAAARVFLDRFRERPRPQ